MSALPPQYASGVNLVKSAKGKLSGGVLVIQYHFPQ